MDASDLEAALQEMGAPRISLTDLTAGTRFVNPWLHLQAILTYRLGQKSMPLLIYQ